MAVGQSVPALNRLMCSSKISDQGDVAAESERVALGRADHVPALGPVDKGVAGVGRGCNGLRTASHKCATAADRAVGLR